MLPHRLIVLYINGNRVAGIRPCNAMLWQIARFNEPSGHLHLVVVLRWVDEPSLRACWLGRRLRRDSSDELPHLHIYPACNIHYFAPIGVRSIAINMYVCLSFSCSSFPCPFLSSSPLPLPPPFPSLPSPLFPSRYLGH